MRGTMSALVTRAMPGETSGGTTKVVVTLSGITARADGPDKVWWGNVTVYGPAAEQLLAEVQPGMVLLFPDAQVEHVTWDFHGQTRAMVRVKAFTYRALRVRPERFVPRGGFTYLSHAANCFEMLGHAAANARARPTSHGLWRKRASR